MVAAVLGGGLLVLSGGGSAPSLSGAALRASVASSYGKLPLRFEANRGQTDGRVDFLSRGPGYSLFLTPSESVLSLSKTAPGRDGKPGATSSAVLRMRLAGGNPHAVVSGGRVLPGATNYLRGKDPSKWQTGMKGFGEVRYAAVYPGVDLVYHGRQGKLEYDFRVAPGADPGAIAMRFSGADKVSIDSGGNLSLTTSGGTVRHDRPLVYQMVDGARRLVPARFVLSDGNRVAFKFGSYDRSRPLVIDPVVVYATYLGGVSPDFGTDIAADAAGNAYIVGVTASPDFPTQSALRGGPARGGQDAFVTKFNATGSAFIYSTYLGGAGSDDARGGIAVGSDGSAYVSGFTDSTDFPTTPGALQAVLSGPTDAYVTKLNPSGSALDYSTFVGGTGVEAGFAVAVDSSGAAYIAGLTNSLDLPVVNAFQPTDAGGFDYFVAKLNAGGTALVYSSYLGGGADDFSRGMGIAVDGTGAAYVVGETSSGGATKFPTTAGAFRETCGTDGLCAGGDGFLSKISASGDALVYSTFLGGAGGRDVALGSGADAGHAFVVTQGGPNLPLSNGALDEAGGVVVTKFNAAGSGLDYSARIFGTQPNSIAVDSAGSAIVTGSTPAEAPVSSVRPINEPFTDGSAPMGFLTRLNPAGTALTWSSKLRGEGAGVAVDATRTVYVTGTTSYFDFPTLNPFQAHNSAVEQFNEPEPFVMKLGPDVAGTPYVSSVSSDTADAAGGRSVRIIGESFTDAEAVSFGAVPASSFAVISDTEMTAVAPAHPEGDVAVTVTKNGLTSPPNPATFISFIEGQWGAAEPSNRQGIGLNGGVPAFVLLNTGRVLIAGGGVKQARLYDPKTGTWSDTGSTNVAHTSISATLLKSGKVLTIGGDFRDTTAEIYDPATGVWTLSQASAPASSRGLLLPNGKVLIESAAGTALYDPNADTFTPTDQQPAVRHDNTVVLKTGKVLFAGGGVDGTASELYDPASDTFAPTGDMILPLAGTATVLTSGKVLFVGDGTKNSELYDPSTGTWALTPGLETQRGAPGAVLLPSGKVLIMGGFAGGVTLRSAVLYDPTLGPNGRYKPAGVMSAPNNNPRPVLLSSDPSGFGFDPAICGIRCGRVLVPDADMFTPAKLPQPAADAVPPPPPADAPAAGPDNPVAAPLVPLGLPIAAVTPKPLLSRLSVSPGKVSKGRSVRVSFRLDRAVAVTVSVRRSLGRGRYTGVLHTLRITGRAGANTATVRASSLTRTGLYRLTAKPAGGVAASVTVRVVRSRRAARSG